VIKFIPYPVTVGFTSGIAVIIFSGQMNDFLGLGLTDLPDNFVKMWLLYFDHLRCANPTSLALALATVLIIVLWPRLSRRFPGAIIAIAAGSTLVYICRLPVETIASRFGSIPRSFGQISLPQISLEAIPGLISPALTIAFLAGIESLLSAVVADGMLGTRHRSNMELVGQGVANLVSPLFGGIPATGAIARTATNIKNGGRTPIAGIIAAACVCVLFLFFSPLVGLIPMAVLAGILVSVAYNMSEWRHFIKLLRSPRSDVAVLILTFLLTILVGLTVAIEVGVVLAAILFMRRMAHLTHISLVDEPNGDDSLHEYAGVPEGVEIFEINGPFFFGAVDKFREAVSSFKKFPRTLILRMSAVPIVDATATSVLDRLIESAHKDGSRIILAGVNKRVYKVLRNTGVVERLGSENIFADVQLALAQAVQ
jgi:SulP family sulfate permease